MKIIFQLSFLMLLFACTTDQTSLDIQGHRGCRGLFPENTIPAFEHALKLGVTTLEMDAVITKDKQVLVSHEPFMSGEICTDPNGQEIPAGSHETHNIYALTYEEVKTYECGSIDHPRFPDQKKMATHKPLLSDVIARAEAYAKEIGRDAAWYNIETKSQPKGDNLFHPEPKEFVDLLVSVVKESGIYNRTTLQSFDVRTLQYAHEAYPDLPLVLLIENRKSLAENLELLGFVPEVYSPYFELVNADLVSLCKEKGMKLVPWTANEPADIQNMLAFEVDGIISDYPDRVLEIVKKALN